MKNFRILMAGFLVCFSQAAVADDANPLIGKWSEKLPNGVTTMIYEFTATSTTQSMADASGNVMNPGEAMPISYRKMGHDDKLGDEYSVDYRNEDGSPSLGSAFLVYLKDPDNIMISVPNVATHSLTRMK